MNEKLEIEKQFTAGKVTRNSLPMSLTGNEKYLASGYDNGLVRYYRRNGNGKPRKVRLNFDFSSYYQIYEHRREDCPCRLCSLSMKGDLLASGSEDFSVQVWNMASGVKVAEFRHDLWVYCVEFHENWLISCSEDRSVRIWDVDNQKLVHQLNLRSDCQNFDISPTKLMLAVATFNGLEIWDLKKTTKIIEFELELCCADVRFNPAGDQIILGMLEGQVYKIDLVFDSDDEDDSPNSIYHLSTEQQRRLRHRIWSSNDDGVNELIMHLKISK